MCSVSVHRNRRSKLWETTTHQCARLRPIGLAKSNAQHFAAPRVAHHGAFFVLSRALAVCARHLLPRIEHAEFVFVMAHVAALVHLAMDQAIQLAARSVIRRDQQLALRLARDFT